MSLSGSLLDFNFTDILQLVKMQRKTGCLALRSREATVALWFEDGNLVFAHDEARSLTATVGRRLAADGLVSEGAWRRAVEEQRRSGRPIAELLVGVDPAPLEPLAAEYLRETVFSVFRWIEGDYTFETEIPSPPDAGAIPTRPLDTGDAMMEAAARADAWSRVDDEIPSWRLIFAPTGGAEAPAQGTPGGPEEAHVLGLLDGRRDVREVIGWSRYGALETCRALAALKAAGRVVAVGERTTEAEGRRPGRGRKPARRRGAAVPAWRMAWRAGVASVASVALVGFVGWLGYTTWGGGAGARPAPLAASTSGYREHQVRAALEVYRLVHGRYPDRLEALVETGLLKDAAVAEGMTYAPAPDGFTLHQG